jgi:hypothetical protein
MNAKGKCSSLAEVLVISRVESDLLALKQSRRSDAERIFIEKMT